MLNIGPGTIAIAIAISIAVVIAVWLCRLMRKDGRHLS